ncbi:hypothetical protein E2P81_ATG03868 [Venturia nashicola]|uniref:Uncharacterized protein n=1 Tax=Venturia nashicola TaxID=86259 RepID=A0A4Z1PK99_9PEZI|nr:hypothetical protein E6O75_ATG03959 [Venturia nashicola]TLD38193.1 hypothetical protein E2P81_ATG03868 [Venturia nashicola]
MSAVPAKAKKGVKAPIQKAKKSKAKAVPVQAGNAKATAPISPMSAVPAKAKKGVKAPIQKAKKSKAKEVPVQAGNAKATAPISQPDSKSTKDGSLVTPAGLKAQNRKGPESIDPIVLRPAFPQLQTHICHGEGNNLAENLTGSETRKKQNGLEEALKTEGGEKEAAAEAQVDKLTVKLRQLPTYPPQASESDQPETSMSVPNVSTFAADPLPKYMAAQNLAPRSMSFQEQTRQDGAYERFGKETNLVANAVAARADVPPHFRAIVAKYACGEASEEENAEVMAFHSERRAEMFGPAQDDGLEMERDGVVVEAGPAIEKSPTVMGGILFPTDLDDDFSKKVESRGQMSFGIDAVDKAEGWEVVNQEARSEDGDEEAIVRVESGQVSVEDTAPAPKKKSWFWPFW